MKHLTASKGLRFFVTCAAKMQIGADGTQHCVFQMYYLHLLFLRLVFHWLRPSIISIYLTLVSEVPAGQRNEQRSASLRLKLRLVLVCVSVYYLQRPQRAGTPLNITHTRVGRSEWSVTCQPAQAATL